MYANPLAGAARALMAFRDGPSFDFDQITTDGLIASEKTRRPAYRFNPSGVARLCMYKRARQIADDRWFDVNAPNPTLGRLGMLGTGIHTEFQNRVYPHIGHRMYGAWTCPTCASVRLGVYPDAPCANTMTVSDGRTVNCADTFKQWEYGEHYFQHKDVDPRDQHFWVTGRLDGIYISDGSWYVIELKTLAYTLYHECYKRKSKSDDPRVTHELVANVRNRLPLESHVEQAQICGSAIHRQWVSGNLAIPATKYGGVIIISLSRDNAEVKTSVCRPDDFPFLNLLAKIRGIRRVPDPASHEKRCRNRKMGEGCYLVDECFPKKKRKSAKKAVSKTPKKRKTVTA